MKNVSAARRSLVLDHPFFGVLSLKLQLIADSAVQTFSTDGRVLRFNPDYASGLSAHELTGVVAHEVLHCANGHTWRKGHRDHKMWNTACDYAINPIVLDAGMVLPEGALVDSQYRDMSAEEIYERLMQQQPESQGDGQEGDGQESDGSVCGEVVDCDEGRAAETQAEWSASVLNASRYAEAMGRLPAGMERLVEAIKNPAQDWRALLRRFVQTNAASDYSWRQPNPRYMYAGLYMPALRSETMPPMVVAIDTSGSIDEVTINQFATEINAIVAEVQPERVHIVYCDAEIHGADVFERGEAIELQPKGFGGTDFRPVFEWIEAESINPSCLVYLTDLMGNFPTMAPDYPVLWGDTMGCASVPWGEVAQIRCN